MTLQPFSPDLAFLGSRDYLHGSTLFNVMIDSLRYENIAPTDLDFIFERRTGNQVSIVPGEPDGPAVKVATLRHAGGVLTAIETEEPITHRQPNVELALDKAFTLPAEAITVQHIEAGYSFIATAIAAFKTILQKREPERKFVFTRLRVPAIPEGAFSVTFHRKIGNRFYEGRIEATCQDAGAIYFGVWS
ncbi:MAG: hypothetical protein WBA42_15170 [Mesorhizobium sp.]